MVVEDKREEIIHSRRVGNEGGEIEDGGDTMIHHHLEEEHSS